MSRPKLVEMLAELAIDEVVDGEAAIMRHPPGRQPPVDLQARSEWFLSLDAEGQSLAVAVMRAAAYGTLHRVLAALDGATPMSEGGSEGRLKLAWETDEAVIDLTDAANEPELHDLLAARRGR